jgi:hypothetical protein
MVIPQRLVFSATGATARDDRHATLAATASNFAPTTPGLDRRPLTDAAPGGLRSSQAKCTAPQATRLCMLRRLPLSVPTHPGDFPVGQRNHP